MFTHIWEYRGYTGYDATTARTETQPYYISYRKQVSPLLVSRRCDLMQVYTKSLILVGPYVGICVLEYGAAEGVRWSV
jgi:hypothetical protein